MSLPLFNPTKYGSRWKQSGNLFFLGERVLKEGRLLDLGLLEEELAGCKDAAQFSKVLNALNGSFALVYRGKELGLAAVDMARSIPLFYCEDQKEVSDGVEFGENDIDREQLAIFEKQEFLPADQCFIKPYVGIEAGNLVMFDENGIRTHCYFEHKRNEVAERNLDYWQAEFSSLTRRMTQRWKTQSEGMQTVIPLSGGFDSRFILAALYKQGLRPICYTYGNENSEEYKSAKRITESLELEWHFIPYERDLISAIQENEWRNYIAYAHNGVSLPLEQEYFALLKLKGVLPENSLILPGYCGDVQAGSYLPHPLHRKKWLKETESAISFLKNNHILPVPSESRADQIADNYEAFLSEMEGLILSERESKYIINGTRVYEYFGYQWMLPLWDREFIEFWQKVPSKWRYGRKLYRTTLSEEYFKELNIDFELNKTDRLLRPGGLLSWVRERTPDNIKKGIKSVLNQTGDEDINNLHLLKDMLAEELIDDNVEKMSLNQVMGKWFQLWVLSEFERKGQ